MFQTDVKVYPAQGRPGQPASTNPIIAAGGGDMTFRAGSNGVKVATFVWRDATDPTLVNNTGTGLPVGFVQNVLTATITDINDGVSLDIMAGREVSPIAQGDFWAEATTDAVVGQKVFAVLADGTLVTGAAGATVTGAVETDWTVIKTGLAGDTFIMSTWSKA